ncbi:MAG: M23 family metallopeptidase [Bacteroidetes bacterium]|nr:M23 family metallopeptidase [Bacteroidota bacterium]
MTPAKDKKKRPWLNKLLDKYRLVIMDDNTLEERISFKLTKLNVFVVLGTITILLIFLTSYIIAFTPLREYIPGYTNVELQKQLYNMQLKTDSIEKDLRQKELYILNFQRLFSGEELLSELPAEVDTSTRYDTISYRKSEEDSMLRKEVEDQARFSIYRSSAEPEAVSSGSSIRNLNFFSPLKGIITNPFNEKEKHFGIDVAAKRDETIKATLDGTVIFTDWTLETGYVMAIQHINDIISVYKHNSALLKKTGDMVRAGDPVAIIGHTGELSSGPHLHFELWYKGSPVDPSIFISF